MIGTFPDSAGSGTDLNAGDMATVVASHVGDADTGQDSGTGRMQSSKDEKRRKGWGIGTCSTIKSESQKQCSSDARTNRAMKRNWGFRENTAFLPNTTYLKGR